jgi:predicted DNA binding protein
MQKLKMIPCPKCERPFPEKRKELGYFVCVNCSTTDKVVGITTVEGTGDHTWNDLIIMDRRKALQIAAKEAEITGRKVALDLEVQDYEKDEEAISQSMNEAITKSLSESQQDTNYDIFDPNKQFEGVKGIDY